MNKLLNIKETCALLNVSASTLRRWDKEGVLTPVRTSGKHRRYRIQDINRYLGIDDSAVDAQQQNQSGYIRKMFNIRLEIARRYITSTRTAC